jgi:hypothetical protein
MRETKTVRLEDLDFEITQMGARQALLVQARLAKALGKGVAGLLGGSRGGSLLDAKIDSRAVSDALSTVLEGLKEEEFVDTVEKLLAGVIHKGQAMTLDHHVFHGRPLLVTTLAYRALEVNFADFFGVLRGRMSDLGALAQRVMSPEEASTGPSGDQSSKASPPLRRSTGTGR